MTTNMRTPNAEKGRSSPQVSRFPEPSATLLTFDSNLVQALANELYSAIPGRSSAANEVNQGQAEGEGTTSKFGDSGVVLTTPTLPNHGDQVPNSSLAENDPLTTLTKKLYAQMSSGGLDPSMQQAIASLDSKAFAPTEVDPIPSTPPSSAEILSREALNGLASQLLNPIPALFPQATPTEPQVPDLPTAQPTFPFSEPSGQQAIAGVDSAAIAPNPPSSPEILSREALNGLVSQLLNPIPAVFPEVIPTQPTSLPLAEPATIPNAPTDVNPSLPPRSNGAVPEVEPSLPPRSNGAVPEVEASVPPRSNGAGRLPQEKEVVSAVENPSNEQENPHSGLYFLSDPEIDNLGVHDVPFDVEVIRKDFPILHQKVNGKPLIWLDNAATTQKPQAVIDAISRFYERDNSNIHRAAHTLAARATDAYEAARESVQRFLGASLSSEIVFVRGTTEAINLVANTWGAKYIHEGDEIILSQLEHHANIVPWQMLAQETGAVLKVIPVNNAGEIILEEYARLLGPRTRLVSVTQVSNALGTILPVKEITTMAHRHNARVLIDGAQGIPHLPVNVQEIDCDFYVFSGHKLFAPTGIGALYAKQEILEDIPPWQGGGSMIRHVTFEETIYADPPAKFEAGTPNIADAVGLKAAIDYLNRVGLRNIEEYEHKLTCYAAKRLTEVPGLRIIGTTPHKIGVFSFLLDGFEPEAVGKRLDQEGIAVRAGHHCAQPTLQRYGLTATVRPSLAFYNTCQEIDTLVEVLKTIRYR